ncbi:hypothetical protein QR680_011783 [Steinernema hermaphroditum]|uniref:Uncharacterized protein n=1 Tax=Steinernema hermaphroditum TaxID=289476 RepID=A0AA39I1I0_9BILA|nr:hypothetical protein QR680_011783 [Steinernema hermaphroditum]
MMICAWILFFLLALLDGTYSMNLYVRPIPNNLVIDGIAAKEVLQVKGPQDCAERWQENPPKAITFDSVSKNCTGYFSVIRGTKKGPSTSESFLLTESNVHTCPSNVMEDLQKEIVKGSECQDGWTHTETEEFAACYRVTERGDSVCAMFLEERE